MELVYVYIGKYKSLENVGINLSEKYKITYNLEESKLNIEESESFIDNFWGERISSVHAIVGDNGAGKTTILKFIRDFFNHGNTYKNQYGFFVFLDKKNYTFNIICCGKNLNFKNFDKPKDIYIINSYSFENIYGFNIIPTEEYLSVYNYSMRKRMLLLNQNVIYISTNLDNNDYREVNQYYSYGGHILNLSTGYLLQHYNIDYVTKRYKSNGQYDKLTTFFNQEILNQFKFLINYKKELFTIPFEPPKFLKISINGLNYEHLNKVFEANEDERYLPEDLTYMYSKYKLFDLFSGTINSSKNKDTKQKTIVFLIETIVQVVIISIFSEEETSRTKYDILFKALLKLEFLENENIKDIIINYKNFISELDNRINKKKPLFNSHISFLEFLYKNIKTISDYVTSEEGYFFNISPKDSNVEFLNTFLDVYAKISHSYRFLDFSWGLSSGEFNYLSVFSRFFSNYKEMCEQTEVTGERFDNLLILMDEPDLTLHPRWQQWYIKTLLRFLPSVYKECNIKIVITTHSPIMLSDIPKKNITFIGQKGKSYPSEERKETFGQNIYTLFDDAFFLDGDTSNMIIGYFSADKIKSISERLSKIEYEIEKNSNRIDYKLELEKLETLINLVGEPIIKKVLKDKWYKINKQLNTFKISSDLRRIFNEYDNLENSEKQLLINYIIDNSK